FSTRGRLLLAKAVEPHDLTATRGLVGVRVRPRLRRFRIGGDGHRHAGLRHGLVLRRRARRVTVLARGNALAPFPRLFGSLFGFLFALPLGLRRPPFLRTAGQTAPKDRRTLSPPRRARPTAPARRRTTRRPRSRSRSPRDPRTGAAGRRSSPWDIARA